MFSKFLKSSPVTSLGRWGVSPEKVFAIYHKNSVYDHNLSNHKPKEYCEFHIKEYINYCTKCYQLMSSNHLEYKNDKFGYLDKKYCKLNK
jgi:hypothetical protein